MALTVAFILVASAPTIALFNARASRLAIAQEIFSIGVDTMTDGEKPSVPFHVLPAESSPAPWRGAGRRFRVTVARPSPRRSGGTRPIEVAADLAHLLEKACAPDRFDPASALVVDREDGSEIPCVWRAEHDPETGRDIPVLAWLGSADAYDIYFDVAQSGIEAPAYPEGSLPSANLLANADFAETKDSLPASWSVDNAALASVQRRDGSPGGRSLRVAVDESASLDADREVAVAQTVDVSRFAGQDVVFECDLLAKRAMYGAPMTVETRQFRSDGSPLQTFAVQPRYLSLELAEGHLVQFRESGRFHPEAASCEVRIRFRLSVQDADTNEIVGGPEAAMTVWLDRVVLRPAERWPWPGASHAGFVEGAFPGQAANGAFEFTGQRRVAFNGASEACLTTGRFNPDPRATHWGAASGTLEFWIKPNWGTGDDRQRVLFDAKAHGHRLHSTIRKKSNGDLEFMIADSAGKYHIVKAPSSLQENRWHHVAATWDHAQAWLQLFVDGKRVGELGPEDEPWPFSIAPEADVDFRGMGITGEDKRSVPMQAFIGGDQNFKADLAAEAAMDDFRVSDTVRYQADFSPSRAPFGVDSDTRALWRFDGDTDGVHAGDDGWVRGFPGCELPPLRETVELDRLAADGTIERLAAAVNPYPSEELFEANRAENRLPVFRPFAPPPDPRFVEYVERRAELAADPSRPARVRAEGDFPPLMRSLTFAHDGADTARLPRWRANDNVVPFSVQTLRETLAAAANNDAEKGPLVMKYADEVTNYFNASYCETLPTLHRPRIAYTFLKALNVYPFDQCGPLNHMLRRMFLAVGISSNNAAGTHHQFQQAFYHGQWRLFDLSARIYWLRRDNAGVVSRRGLEDDLWLKLRQGGHPNAMYTGRVSEATFGQAVRPHSMAFALRPGEQAAISWNNEGRWFELTGQREAIPLAKIPPVFGNGTVVFEPPPGASEAAELDNLAARPGAAGVDLATEDPSRPSAFVYSAACPYIFTDAAVAGAWSADRKVEATVSFSSDGGDSWTEVWRGAGRAGKIDAALLGHVSARYAWKAKVAFSPGATVLSGLRVRSVFAASPYVHPEALRLGDNSLALVGQVPQSPVKAELRWAERRKTDLGMSLNALSFYLDGDRTHRNVFVAEAGTDLPVTVALQGRRAEGSLSLESESLPTGWIGERSEVSVPDGSARVEKTLSLKPTGARPGDIHAFDVVLDESGRRRRLKAQILCAPSPLVREAEAADVIAGEAAPKDLAEASGAKVLEFSGRGEAGYDLRSGAAHGAYALWVRARWEQGSAAGFSLKLGDAKPRELRARALIGFTDWTNPSHASAKMFAHFGEQYAHWSWYRVPDVVIEEGAGRLSVLAGAGTAFDALVLLPQTPEMDRAAMNLFHNWNYAPWEQPL